MTKKSIIWIVAVIAVAAVLVIPKITGNKKAASAPASKPKAMPVKVTLAEVKKQPLTEGLQVTGNVRAMEEVQLASETQGRVVKIGFSEGSEVKKGQLLLKINDADLRAQLRKAQSALKLRTDSEKRSEQLLAKGAISQETYDIAITDLNAIEADIELLKEQIRKTEIIAPFSGVIGLRYVSEGGYVSNTTPIALLQQLEKVKIEFSVPEKYASKIKTGNSVTFTIEGDDEVFKASIYAIEPQVDAATRNVVMRAICANPSRRLLPGAFARVNVQFGDAGNVLTIPTQSVIPILKGQKVFVMQGDSAAERVINTGKRTEKFIEVKSGLKPGEKVVVNGVMYLKQGSKIRL